MALLYGALAYIAGILAGRILFDAAGFDCPLPGWLWLLPVALLPLTALLKRLAPSTPPPAMRWPVTAGFDPPHHGLPLSWAAMIVLCTAAGVLRYAGQPATPCWTPDDLAYYNLPASLALDYGAPQSTVTGFIASYPLVDDVKQEMVVAANTIEVDGILQPVTGRVSLTAGLDQHYRYGQPVSVTGRLVLPPEFENFSYAEYLARQGIHSLIYNAQISEVAGKQQGNPVLAALYALRQRGEAFLNRTLPEPYAALANGMILGIEAGIPDDLYAQFNATGTSHIIVISGSNVALVASVIMALMARVAGRARAVWFTVAGVACYALLVGGDAAVMRAAVMGSLAIIAAGLNRRSTGLVSLSTAYALMTLRNPLALWDVGLQLSSAATAGLMLVAPGMSASFHRFLARWHLERISRRPAGSFFEESVMVTLAANITTLPLVVYYFGRMSIVSLLTNTLILPAQPPILLAGSSGVVAGIAGLESVGQAILTIPWLCLSWTVRVVQWSASLPGADLKLTHFGLPAMLAIYALLALVQGQARLQHLRDRVRSWTIQRGWQRLASPVPVGGLAAIALLTWTAAIALPDGRLHLWFLNIGQGDGILIQTPSGRQVLIDGGASPEVLFSELGAVMPFWDRTLDLLLLTHADSDHMAAQTEIPARYRVGQAIHSTHAAQHPEEAIWRKRMAAAGVTVTTMADGGWIDLGDGVALWVLAPALGGYAGTEADNENSLVTKLVYGNFSALFTGDAGPASEARMIGRGAPLQSTVLKLSHHGSRSSSGQSFLDAVLPSFAVIQVGAGNKYDHPAPDVLDRLGPTTVLRNDLDGRIHLQSDGVTLWIAHEQDKQELAPPTIHGRAAN